ncbi:MAG: hypothetical protein ABH833_01390 [Parcubacteria group bacterium]
MQFKQPQNDDKYQWTNHVKDKMMYYGISVSLVKRIVRHPKRTEEGVALDTIAVMQSGTNKKKPSEIWVMYQDIKRSKGNSPKMNILQSKAFATQPKRRIISAWRYPGISPMGKKIPIPDEILQELESVI